MIVRQRQTFVTTFHTTYSEAQLFIVEQRQALMMDKLYILSTCIISIAAHRGKLAITKNTIPLYIGRV